MVIFDYLQVGYSNIRVRFVDMVYLRVGYGKFSVDAIIQVITYPVKSGMKLLTTFLSFNSCTVEV